MLILHFFLVCLLKKSLAMDQTCHLSILKHFNKDKIDVRMVDKQLNDRDFPHMFLQGPSDLVGISFKNNSFTKKVFYHLSLGNLHRVLSYLTNSLICVQFSIQIS